MTTASGSSALNGKLVTVFGGSGFLGRHVVRALARRGYRVRVAVRRPDLAEHVQPLGAVGQIMPVQANLRHRWSVDRAVQGADAVVNLVGILYEAGAQSFDAVQAFGPRAVAEAARAEGIDTVVHVSAIGADPESPSVYGRSKAMGEAGVFETLPEAVVFRPSIVFGPEDGFFNRFASMARMSPALPLVGGGVTRFQPVFVGDVAEAIAMAVDGKTARGTIYELGGPEIKTFKECLELMLQVIRRKRLLVTLPFSVARVQASVLQLLPKPLLTVDQVELLKSDNIVSEQAIAEGRTLEALGIEARALLAILPTYLERFREHGQYDANRAAS
jgi:NADH dehydrogenase